MGRMLKTSNLLDYAMTVFGLIMLFSSYYVYKLSKLSEAWKPIWFYFAMFLLLLPGSRIVIDIIYEQCPAGDFAQYFLRIVCPIVGSLFFFLTFRKLYRLFAEFLNGKNREEQE
jgi:hypothetical protein